MNDALSSALFNAAYTHLARAVRPAGEQIARAIENAGKDVAGAVGVSTDKLVDALAHVESAIRYVAEK